MSHVFVVEDDETVLKLMLLTLSREGYEVAGFRSADEAMPHLHEAPAVLISDVQMPGIGGLDLAAAAKSIEVGPIFRTPLLCNLTAPTDSPLQP